MGQTLAWIQRKVMAEEEHVFPDTLEGFGYHFNTEGLLRTIDQDEEFKFEVREGDHAYNQKHYNALGELIEKKIYSMMERDYKLQRTYLPMNAEEGEPRTFVFHSGDLYTNADKMLILVHGNGVVRAGQWARRLIINDCLNSGTQFPFIKWGRENGYSVIVANPNLNTLETPEARKRKTPIKIRNNSTPEEHLESVWRELVQRTPAKHVAIVAHSYGGVASLELAKNHLREFEERVFAMALTDSVHSLRQQEAEPDLVQFYKQHVVNWASAYDPLDAPLQTSEDEVPTVSAGTDKHEYTSYSSMHSIFKYFCARYEQTVHPTSRPFKVGEPNSLTEPTSSESQHLITRGQGEGEYSPEHPTQTPIGENGSNGDMDTDKQTDTSAETETQKKEVKSEL
ncbi:F172A-like protein [Mya arenaria]|uniref:F172A-like protein n=1 Tax=Mya arenaria TaxID=6604 RepID=A0ABY7DQF1_MYAAR|nr:cotranscriptional regulator FAM172A homolog [Mya arenaria]WAQ99946.1 F172A-like protein [Mya arenaria]